MQKVPFKHMRTSELALDLYARLDLADAPKNGVWQSVVPEARDLLVASLLKNKLRKTLIITSSYERALQWHTKLTICGVSGDSISLLPSGNSSLFEDSMPEHIALSDRLGALRKLIEDVPHIVIATPQAALERTLPRDLLLDSFIELRPGDQLDITVFLKQLVCLGYEHQEPVRQPGGFNRRGGILDVFPVGRETPMRVELFGDEIESLRIFDPNTQRSIGNTNELRISPSRETLFLGEEQKLCDILLSNLEREMAGLTDESAVRLEELVKSDIETIQSNLFFDRLDLYRPLLHPESGCAIDLLDEDSWLILDEPIELEMIVTRSEEELGQALTARHERGEILTSFASDFMLPAEHLSRDKNSLSITAMNALPKWLKPVEALDFGTASLEPYRGRSEVLTQTLRNYLDQKFEVVVTTDQPNRAISVLSGIDIAASQNIEPGLLTLVGGNLGGGFVIPDAKIAVLSDAELFGVARLKLPQKRFMEGAPVATVLDLKPGDYVVHIHFGIGIFRGLIKRPEQGIEKEFLFIEYSPPDKLYVPIDQLDRIQKYLNPGDEHPKINRLIGTEWQRTLGKAKEEAREFARDLVKIYAKRKQVQRRPFSPDTPWQDELEATFPYVETPAQLSAIQDVKRDLEEPFPMDRLICGDVGFGKTEVAIRGAFKAVQDGRQVAVLCPTTILCEQHFRNFSERLLPFGTRLEMINRFTHAGHRKQILEKIKTGEIDILIGTHALLGAGIQFKNLGLVVVDEEQKFGVKQKEMLKNLRTEVDFLTLSATPIPRTLSMALMDIRQMSLINDPPPGRLAVRTYLRGYGNDVVREAILRELSRGGQVFYVYNRVNSIGHVAQRLKTLIPSARIGVGHGQMTEHELEPIMVGFIKGEIDVLLSTTIIENGIDISNANTLIVENADQLGLSQLYQLRGRVGRSDRQAYAYFLYSSTKDITENALARLQALQEFSNLGSGYSLAFRDLQIRGAGELLGSKQHGTMASVGYELFTQLINEAVAMLKNSVDGDPGQSLPDVDDPLVSAAPLPLFDLPVEAFFPESYVRDQGQRLYYYQRLMSVRKENLLGEISAEMQDRYGKLPEEVLNAFQVIRLRMRAKKLGIEKVEAKEGRIAATFHDISKVSPRIFSIISKNHREFYVARESVIWAYSGSPLRAVEWLFSSFDEAAERMALDRAALDV